MTNDLISRSALTEKGKTMRDIDLKPREVGNRNPEELARILSGIYPQRTVEELMTHFGFVKNEEGERNGAEE